MSFRVVTAIDPAIGLSQRADFFVAATAGRDDVTGKIHILDIFRDRIQAPDQPRVIEDLYRRFRPSYVALEQTYSQTSLGQYVIRRGIVPTKIIDLRTRKQADKTTRAEGLRYRYAEGQIIHPPRASWLDAYEEELLAFPNGEHDDQVDAVVYAVEELTFRQASYDGPKSYDFSYDDNGEDLSDHIDLFDDVFNSRRRLALV